LAHDWGADPAAVADDHRRVHWLARELSLFAGRCYIMINYEETGAWMNAKATPTDLPIIPAFPHTPA
jgi:hypothetical protein